MILEIHFQIQRFIELIILPTTALESGGSHVWEFGFRRKKRENCSVEEDHFLNASDGRPFYGCSLHSAAEAESLFSSATFGNTVDITFWLKIYMRLDNFQCSDSNIVALHKDNFIHPSFDFRFLLQTHFNHFEIIMSKSLLHTQVHSNQAAWHLSLSLRCQHLHLAGIVIADFDCFIMIKCHYLPIIHISVSNWCCCCCFCLS